MTEYVTQKEFSQEMKEVRKEAKEDRHEFVTTIQKMLDNFDVKLEKIIENYVKIEIMEKDVSSIKDEFKDIKKDQKSNNNKILVASGAIGTVAGLGSFAAQIFFK